MLISAVCLHSTMNMDGFWRVATIVGTLVAVGFGAWLTERWQRKKWILDNKVAEYRGILDALNSYRFALTEYYSLYKIALVAVPAQKKYDDDVALARAVDRVNNSFADRIFTRKLVSQSGARADWSTLADKLRSNKSGLDELLKIIDSIHDKLVKASQTDLKLYDT
jgi:hypothetical protein